MAQTSPKKTWSLVRTTLPTVSLLSLVACGAAVEETRGEAQPVITSKGALDGAAWRTEGVFTGGAGGVASSLYTLMPTGDENGDGVADYLLGQPIKKLSANVQGQVAILSGADLSVIKTLDSEELGTFGWGVTSLGDINKDERIDYAVGVPVTFREGVKSYAGRVYVLRSNAEGGYERSLIDDTDASGYFGFSLASLGGNKDVLAVSRPNFRGGRAFGYAVKYDHKDKFLYESSSELNNDAELERRGYTIEATSDLDGDGTQDFMMHAAGQNPNGAATYTYAGRVYFHSGRTGELLKVVQGPAPTSQLGGFGSELDDVNGDGVTDFIFGAPYYRVNGITMAGAAWVVDGAAVRSPEKFLSLAEHPEAVLRMHAGTSSISLLGYATANLFDVDGDGVDEYVVGAPGVSRTGLPYSGKVVVYNGATGEEVHTFFGQKPYQWWGEGLRADAKAKGLVIASWHAESYHGRVELLRFTGEAAVASPTDAQ